MKLTSILAMAIPVEALRAAHEREIVAQLNAPRIVNGHCTQCGAPAEVCDGSHLFQWATPVERPAPRPHAY